MARVSVHDDIEATQSRLLPNRSSADGENKPDEQGEKKEKEFPDKFNAAYLIFFLCGAGLLFPWNAFITAVDYFDDIFPDKRIEYSLAVGNMVPNLLFLLVVVKWGMSFSFGPRIVVGYTIAFGAMLAMVFLSTYQDEFSEGTAYAYTLVCVVCAGSATAVTQGSVFGFAGSFPQQYTHAVMAGNAVAGLIVCVARLATKAGFSNDSSGLQKSAVIYFSLSAGTMYVSIALALAVTHCNFLCIIGFLVLLRLPLTEYYRNKAHSKPGTREEVQVPDEQEMPHRASSDTERTPLLPSETENVPEKAEKDVQYKEIMKNIRPFALSVMSVFWISLSVFPGVVVQIPTQDPGLKSWFGIILITIFNSGDFIGRLSAEPLKVKNQSLVPYMALSRLCFIPLFILCVHPRIIHSDYVVYAVMMLFAVSNGYVSTMSMMFGPGTCEPRDREHAGTMMVLFLTLGLAMGSVTSLGFKQMLPSD